MLFISSLVLAGVATLASAQHNSYAGYIAEVCTPLNSSSLPDMNAPCNGLQAVQLQCIYGPDAGLKAFYDLYKDQDGSSSYGLPDDLPEQSNRTQQICTCESQFFDLLDGCTACDREHGSGDIFSFFGTDYIASLRQDYCAASATPSVDLADFLNDYTQPTTLPATLQSAYSAAQTSSFSDRIGNKTEVSYYYTPSITGPAAWQIAEATGSAGASGAGTFATVATVSGQIVPTASHSSSNAGARETAAVMGVMGLLGVVAML